MEIVVNDTNIFIDLHSIGLLYQFFELPITVHTVDFVINELTDEEQFKAINKYIENGKLKVQSFEELLENCDQLHCLVAQTPQNCLTFVRRIVAKHF